MRHRHSSYGENTVPETSSLSKITTTIAVFGANGPTGCHFLRLALDAGYHVRTLVEVGKAGSLKEWVDQPALRLLTGSLDDEHKVKRCIRGAHYVVCLLSDALSHKKHEYPKGFLMAFVQRLYPLMKKEESIQLFLYQATSLAADVQGRTPVFSKVLKTVAHRRNQFLKDQDAVVRFLAHQHGIVGGEVLDENDPQQSNEDKENNNRAAFDFVVTRPTVLLQDGPSTKKLAASKSQPGPFSITNVDLAEFTLNALLNKKLFNTCPYVVADGFSQKQG